MCPSAEYGKSPGSLSRRLTSSGRGTADSARDLRSALAGGPVGADGTRRLDQQWQVVADQYVKRSLGGVRVHVQRGDDPALAIAQRHGDRPDAGGELLIGERPAASADLAERGGSLACIWLPAGGDAGPARFGQHALGLRGRK